MEPRTCNDDSVKAYPHSYNTNSSKQQLVALVAAVVGT